MIRLRRTSPKTEFRLREIERVNNSVSLAEKFPKLKSLTVNLTYFDTDRHKRSGELRYEVNVHHAKSAFSFVCPNHACVGGAFDLSEVVACAVSGRRKIAEGEIRCPGWHTIAKEDKVPCHKLLRYKLNLGYV